MEKKIADKQFFTDLRVEIGRSVPSKARFVKREPTMANKEFFECLRKEIASPEDLSKEIMDLRQAMAEMKKALDDKEREITALKSAKPDGQLGERTLSKKEVLCEFLKNMAKYSKEEFTTQESRSFRNALSEVFDQYYDLDMKSEIRAIRGKRMELNVTNNFEKDAIQNHGQMNVGGGNINS